MKVTQGHILLAIHITGLGEMEDLSVLIEAGQPLLHPPQLIIRASARTWSGPLFCGDEDPVIYLAGMSECRLRDALEFSRPFSYRDAEQVRQLTSALGNVIPMAVRSHLADSKEHASLERSDDGDTKPQT